MPHPDIDTVLAWRGRTVRDPEGEKLGKLGDLFLDRETDRPAWAGIHTGLFGMKESYVPLERIEDDGEDLRVPFTKGEVDSAPRIEPDTALTEDEEAALWRHYGQEYVRIGDDAPTADGEHDGPSRLGDDAMTRSEEEVTIGEGPMKAAERVRLRKVMVTEHVKQTVPVRKEVIQLETEPAPEGRIESVEDVDGS